MTHPILVFTHIPKTGGQTIVYLLRRHFGLAGLTVRAHGGPAFYRPQDLRADLRIMPVSPRCLDSHSIRPCVDFQEFEHRLVWFTMLREPVQRYISQYLYNYEVRGERFDVLHFIRHRPDKANRQVGHLAGTHDLEAAKGHLRRMAWVGLMERFDESLLLMRDRLGIEGMDLRYGQPRNVGDQRRRMLDREEVRATFDRHRDEVISQNKLDLELYEFAQYEIWPQQVVEYGEPRLARHLKTEFCGQAPRVRHTMRLSVNFAFRNLVYKPWCGLTAHLASYSAPPLQSDHPRPEGLRPVRNTQSSEGPSAS